MFRQFEQIWWLSLSLFHTVPIRLIPSLPIQCCPNGSHSPGLGWSDFAIFFLFLNWAHCCWSDIFLAFHCQTVKKLQIPSFYSKEQSPKRKFGIKFCLLFFRPQKWAKLVFNFCPSWMKKKFCFSSVLAFKQAKEQIFFQGQPLKMFFFIIWLL